LENDKLNLIPGIEMMVVLDLRHVEEEFLPIFNLI
jgi:hypothetical protein